MVFKYYDGRVDKRYCLTIYCTGTLCYAVMVNEDYSTEDVLYDDYDTNRRIGNPVMDCPKDVKVAVREKAVMGKSGLYADVGDVVEVVKGRKFPKGMKMVVHAVYSGGYSHVAGRYLQPELEFGSENGLERVAADNVRVVAIKGGSVNQEEYADVHSVSYCTYKGVVA